MQSPKDTYVKEMSRKFGYRPTWHPGERLRVGDVGRIENNVFSRETSLKLKKIPYTDPYDHPASKPILSDLDYTSSQNVSKTIKASGDPNIPGSALQLGKAGVAIEFKGGVAIVFQAVECQTIAIEDQERLGQEIIRLWQRGAWEKDYIIVTEVVQAKSGSVIISNAGGGKIDLEAQAGLATGPVKIGDASLGLSVVAESNIATKIIASAGMTPLYKAKAIHTSLFSPPDLRLRGLVALESLALRIGEGQTIFFGDVPVEDEEQF